MKARRSCQGELSPYLETRSNGQVARWQQRRRPSSCSRQRTGPSAPGGARPFRRNQPSYLHEHSGLSHASSRHLKRQGAANRPADSDTCAWRIHNSWAFLARRSHWPSVFPSTRTWCVAFSRLGTARNQTRWARPGSRSWSREGQSVGSGSVSVRIGRPPYTLGARRDGQCTRRIVGFGVHRGVVDGVALCQMFNRAMGRQPAPTYLSSDHDPLYRFHQWQANLNPRRGSHQDGAVCAAVASVRRTPDRHDSARVS